MSAETSVQPKECEKYLTFALESEQYGLSVLCVQEILGFIPTTSIPKVPDCILGVINLRGKVVPVVDLRRLFGMEAKPLSGDTCIIVVEVSQTVVGIVVDRVLEVAEIAPASLEPAPEFGGSVNTAFIDSLAKQEASVVILLNITAALKGIMSQIEAPQCD